MSSKKSEKSVIHQPKQKYDITVDNFSGRKNTIIINSKNDKISLIITPIHHQELQFVFLAPLKMLRELLQQNQI